MADTAIAALHAANNFFECAKPWELMAGGSSPNAQRLQTIISMTMDALRLCGIVLQPMMPQLTSRLLDKLNVPISQRSWRHLSESFATASPGNGPKNHQLDEQSSAHLFQRIVEQPDKPTEQRAQSQTQSKRSKSKKERKTSATMS